MVAIAEAPAFAAFRPIAVAPQPAPDPAPAVRLARAYLDDVSAYWRGELDRCGFRARLARYWDPRLAPVGDVQVAAESPHGAGGRGLAWCAVDGEVWGCVVGARGGYRVPVAALPTLLPDAPTRPAPAGARPIRTVVDIPVA